MPMIHLTLPAGVLTAERRAQLQEDLAGTLLKWEGAPDSPFFRAQAWSRVDEIEEGRFRALGDDAPRFRVDVTVPQGALSSRRKAGLAQEVTQKILATAGISDADALRVWVLIHEQPDGTWAAAGNIVSFDQLVALAAADRT